MLLVAFTCSVFWAGWEWRDRACDLTVSRFQEESAINLANAHLQARIAENRLQRVSDDISKKQREIDILRQQMRESIRVEANSYVTSTPRFNIPSGWVFLHNYTACRVSGASDATCRANAPAGIARDDKAIKTIADNYVLHCKRWRDQVLGFQEYSDKLRKEHGRDN